VAHLAWSAAATRSGRPQRHTAVQAAATVRPQRAALRSAVTTGAAATGGLCRRRDQRL